MNQNPLLERISGQISAAIGIFDFLRHLIENTKLSV
jgi:hypothetical protein